MPSDTVHVLDGAQLRVLSNPLRQEILGLLCGEALSAARLTERLERPPANLHYHLERLRSAGLAELVEERPVRGATEKFFRAVASNFSIAPETLSRLPAAGIQHRLLPVIRRHAEWVLGELGPALSGPGASSPVTSHQRLRLTAAEARRLRERLLEWLEDCRRADGGAERGDEPMEDWALFSAFFRRAQGGP